MVARIQIPHDSGHVDNISGADHCDPGFEMNYFFSDKVDNNVRNCRENNSMLIVWEVANTASCDTEFS